MQFTLYFQRIKTQTISWFQPLFSFFLRRTHVRYYRDKKLGEWVEGKKIMQVILVALFSELESDWAVV